MAVTNIISISRHTDNKIKVKPDGYMGKDVFAQYLSITKQNAAIYDSDTRCQVVTIDNLPKLLRSLVDGGFKFNITEEIKNQLESKADTVKKEAETADIRLESLEKKFAESGLCLYPFQRAGVKWMAPRDRAGLFDQMGLGKSVQAVAALPENVPVIVVCPASIKGVWKYETNRWRSDIKPYIMEGRGIFSWPKPGEMYIYNYDILPGSPPSDCPQNLVVIADEIHYCKSSKSKRSQRFREIKDVVLKNNGKVWLLTGSPLLNRPPELWNVLEAANLAHDAFGTFKNFCYLFQGNKGRYGFDWGTPLPEVPELLKKVSLHRRRADVLPDLPDKMFQSIEVDIYEKEVIGLLNEITQELEYEGIDIATATLEQLQGLPIVFENIARLRGLIAKAKIPHMLEIIEEYEEEEIPLVVFSAHREPVDLLGQRQGWVTITGSTPNDKRSEIVKSFQDGMYRGVALTIQAGGLGITLTRASHALFVDRMWTPALNSQAEDRLARIGQVNKVVIKDLVCSHPLEKRVYELLGIKQNIIKYGFEDSAVSATEIQKYEFSSDAVRLANNVILDSTNDIVANFGAVKDIINDNVKVEATVVEKKDYFREASNPIELWAAQGLMTLAACDPDRAREINGVGFNKMDGVFGHSLVKQLKDRSGLSDKQWRAAISLLKKYQRQVGPMPLS